MSGTLPDAPAASADPDPLPTPRLVVVLGAKGGCGTTLVATHLAASLAARRRACIVDLDVGKGDVAGWLDLRSGRSINLLFDTVDDLDEQLVDGSVDAHASGLHVLAQPYDLAQLHQVDGEEVQRLLSAVRERYEEVVVDVGSRVDVGALTCALAADEMLLVVTPDVLALRDARRTLTLLRRLGVPDGRVRLVLNHRDAEPAVTASEVEAQLGQPLAATISHDAVACARATLRGQLLHEVAPHAVITGDLRSLSDPGHADGRRRRAWPWHH